MRTESLAEYLGLKNTFDEPEPERPVDPLAALADITDATEFCRALVRTREYRQSILDRIKLGDLAPAVECRILDHAWGAPPKKLELSGKDGGPLEVVRVERVIVDMGNHVEEAVH